MKFINSPSSCHSLLTPRHLPFVVCCLYCPKMCDMNRLLAMYNREEWNSWVTLGISPHIPLISIDLNLSEIPIEGSKLLVMASCRKIIVTQLLFFDLLKLEVIIYLKQRNPQINHKIWLKSSGFLWRKFVSRDYTEEYLVSKDKAARKSHLWFRV